MTETDKPNDPDAWARFRAFDEKDKIISCLTGAIYTAVPMLADALSFIEPRELANKYRSSLSSQKAILYRLVALDMALRDIGLDIQTTTLETLVAQVDRNVIKLTGEENNDGLNG